MKNVLFLAILLCSFQAFSTNITISGAEYAGKTFSIQTLDNFLTNSNRTLKEITISASGETTFKLEINSPQNVFFNFDIYRGWFIAEPNKEYHFELPQPTNEYVNSPYFETTSFHLISENPDTTGINYRVEKFMTLYNSELDKNAPKIIYGRNAKVALETISSIETNFKEDSNQYFSDFRSNNYASIELLAQPRSKNTLFEKYVNAKNIDYNRPDFANMFIQFFNDYFTQFNGTPKAVSNAIAFNYGKSEEIISFLKDETKLNQQACEAILLANLETLFFSRQFNPNGLLKIVSEIENSSTTHQHVLAAQKLTKSFKLHLPGSDAPALNLADDDVNSYNWNSFYFKHVYLYFANSDSATFHRNILYLDKISKAFPRELEIAIVLPENNYEEFSSIESAILNRFTLLKAQPNDEVYNRFDITKFPTFYLVDPQGKIVWFQTPWPEEKFATKFKQLISQP